MADGTKLDASRDATFHTTRWTRVLAAAGEGDGAREALAALCTAYWYPLYAYARRRGAGAEDAADLVQGFFARWIEKRDLRAVTPEKGRFRSFLLATFQHHLANARDRELASKRGGGRVVLAIDFADGDERFEREPARSLTPEQEFERAWALEVLAAATERVEREYRSSSRGELFDALRGELAGASAPHAEVAERLGTSAGAVKVAAHRLRERFGESLRAIVAETVASPAAVDAEIGALLRALSTRGPREKVPDGP